MLAAVTAGRARHNHPTGPIRRLLRLVRLLLRFRLLLLLFAELLILRVRLPLHLHAALVRADQRARYRPFFLRRDGTAEKERKL
jgi:hypothetical protein